MKIGLTEIAEMLAHRLVQQDPVGVLVDRLRSLEIGIAEIGKLPKDVAAVVVEADHQLVIDLGQTI